MKTHVYERQFDPAAEDSLAIIARQVSRGSSVLDVGTGSGTLGHYLSRSLDCTVDGTTLSEGELQLAAPNYRDLKIVDLNRECLSELFGERRYDCIVFADVLEHLARSEEVLADARRLLAPGGRIFVSVPNVLYAGVVYSMMLGTFTRTLEGLLDATHVRFFDRGSLRDMVARCGLTVAHEAIVAMPLARSEFRKLSFDLIPAEVRGYVESRPQSAAYQFVLTLQQADGAPREVQPEDLPALVAPPVRPEFMAQVFIDRGQGFSEEDTLRQYVYGDQERVSVSFALSGPVSALRALRVDFCDRPGVFAWKGLRLVDREGRTIWDWACRMDLVRERNELELYALDGDEGYRVWATGEDPWVLIALPELAGRQDHEWTVELDMTPPRSYDALTALDQRKQTDVLLARQQEDAAEIRRLNALLVGKAEELSRVETAWSQMQEEMRRILEAQAVAQSQQARLLDELQALHGRLQNKDDECHAQLQEFQAQLHEFQAQLQKKDEEFYARLHAKDEELRAEKQALQNVYSSLSWRMTQPIRYVLKPFRR